MTISGDNNNGIGYVPGNTVHVDVAGPNGNTINTKNLGAGKTYVYLITLDDGSTIQFQFGLK